MVVGMMMSLGQFVFSLATGAYQQLQRATQYRQAATSRVGELAAVQFVGPGDDTITLDGLLLPGLSGKLDTLDTLRSMAAEGAAWVLVDGTGTVHGAFVITQISETQTLFFADGTPRRIAFTINLRHVADDQVARNPVVAGPAVGSIGSGGNAGNIA